MPASLRATLNVLLRLSCLLGVVACGGSSGPTGGSSAKPLPATKLVFRTGPTKAFVAAKLVPITVELRDKNDKLVVHQSVTVALSLTATSAKLAGTKSVTTVQGVATFGDLRVDAPEKGLKLVATSTGLAKAVSVAFDVIRDVRHLILMIADGWGYKHIEATNAYTRTTPVYAAWNHVAMSTWDVQTQGINKGVGYDPTKAWKDVRYLVSAATDSAAAATAMFTGQKTDGGNISVSKSDQARLFGIGELAGARGLAVGTVTTVPISHATPGAWIAHNSTRANGYAIADEGMFGHPNTTGTTRTDPAYGGAWGATLPLPSVILGGGHPNWNIDPFVNAAMLAKLRAERGAPWTLVERIAGHLDAGARLLGAASDPRTTHLLGLFGGPAGNMDFRLANGSGENRENPTLSQMAQAALRVLERKPNGFALMIEGGAVDWAGHANNMDFMLGEMIGFNKAVEAVVAWINDASNGSDWTNTLLIVAGDHECGGLTAGPGILPNKKLGEISDRTLKLEKTASQPPVRASWEDANANSRIDPGETVYWAWNSGGHSNSLIPLFAKGRDAEFFQTRTIGVDPVRGKWIENTTVFAAMKKVLGL